MKQLIWMVYLVGLFVAIRFWGMTGRVVFCAGVLLAVTVFRRRLVLALTSLSSKTGLIRGTINQMPSAIHLVRASGPTEAASPIIAAMSTCKFVDAGSWNIVELPKIQVTLMIHSDDGLLAAIESAAPIGAQMNIHSLYPDGKVFSVTNTELPVPTQSRPNVKRLQFPRCAPAELVKQARAMRPPAGFRVLKVEEAPLIYQELYAEEIRFRKGKRY